MRKGNGSGKHPGESARQYAYRVLYQRIISLEMEPGTVLNDEELAVELCVSRTPVREAILSLSEARLVEILPQRSSRVSLIDIDTVEEGIFLRYHVELGILREAALRADTAGLSALRENLACQEKALAEGRFSDFNDLDNAFHRQLYNMANKPWAWDIVTKSVTHLDRLRRLQLRLGEETLRPSMEEHKRFYLSVLSHTPCKDEELYGHITNQYRSSLHTLMEAYPGFFRI